jgi:hypothetical protein
MVHSYNEVLSSDKKIKTSTPKRQGETLDIYYYKKVANLKKKKIQLQLYMLGKAKL